MPVRLTGMTPPLYTPGLSPLELLRDLIALPSVNPMGRPADGPHFYESRVTDYLERLFQRTDMRTGGRLADVQAFCRAGQVPLLGHGNESAKLV